MLKSKNSLLYVFIAIMGIYSIGYFITANNISYAFSYDEEQSMYDSRLNLIKLAAESYGEKTEGLFAEDDTVYVTVDDLIKSDYIVADDENGSYFDPTSDVKTLNDLRVRITNKDGKIKATVLS